MRGLLCQLLGHALVSKGSAIRNGIKLYRYRCDRCGLSGEVPAWSGAEDE